MDYNYSGKSLEECLEQAEKELSIKKNEINYEITKEEKSFLKKKYEIIVHVPNGNNDENSKDEANISKIEEVENSEVKIEANKVIINTKESLELEFQSGTKVFVNNVEVNNLQKVTSEDDITFQCEKVNGIREMRISIDGDKMKANISLQYLPEQIITLSCRKVGNRIKLIQDRTPGQLPPFYSTQEIIQALKDKGVVFGILLEKLDEIISQREVKDVIIAEGIPVENDIDDVLDVKFESTKRNIREDSMERIDYRNLYSITNVQKGDVLAELIHGKEGHNGKNLFGLEIKKKTKKTLKLQANEGCIVEGDKVVATTEGRPTIKSGVFYVNRIFEISQDVDMKSGNINFVGDVKIAGSVREGMQVEAGNLVEIVGNVEMAKVIAQGETHIKGNCITANILVGSKDYLVQQYLTELQDIKEELESLMNSYEEISQRNLLGNNRSTGEIIKVLLETKYKDLQKKSMMILVNNQSSLVNGQNIKRCIRSKIIGSGPLSIKYSSELYELIKEIEIEIEPLASKLMIPVDIYLNYCQDSTIKATGDIIITGKGQYICNLSARGSIIFEQPGAISRGGVLVAGKDIKAKTIGSAAGVANKLIVPRNGIITADIAYQNSIFSFEERSYTLEVASKELRAYLDDKGEIVVDKFVL